MRTKIRPEKDLPRPARGLLAQPAYSVPRAASPVDLRLDANEGPAPAALELRQEAEDLRRYPDPRAFERDLARRFDLDPERVLVTAGADDGILRSCLAFLDQGRELVLPVPAFEMIPRYARLAGAAVRSVPEEDGRYPLAGVLDAIAASGPQLGMVAVVSPSNPTGSVASAEDLRQVARAAGSALVLVDLAYAEYADEDLTECALELANCVVLRTLSKAWSLAGARVGWALGSPARIAALRAAGAPFAVSSSSLALATARLETGQDEMRAGVERVRHERARLHERLQRLGARPRASQANFVLAQVPDALWLRDALAGLGIGVRAFPERPELEDCVRITCPGEPMGLARLERALESSLSPEALLFDLDGVLADVSGSYRKAIQATAGSYDVELSLDVIERAKAAGNANCDWRLTRSLLAEAGVEATLEEVTSRFEGFYQGNACPGLWTNETSLVERALLERLRQRLPLAIVTGRPRADALRFLESQGMADLFEVVVARQDAALKPDPAPVRRALSLLEVQRAWMVGDTPDDVRAARSAGVVPLGILAPGCRDPQGTCTALTQAGAARVLSSLSELEGLLS